MRDGDRAAVRAVYDLTAERYVEFAGTTITAATETSADRQLLDDFVAGLASSGLSGLSGVVADLGCGPGRVASLLHAAGHHVVGVDIAPAMLAIARRCHPSTAFVGADLARLPMRSRSVSAAISWYSIIHTPPAGLRVVFREFARVLTPDAPLLVAFQSGDGDVVTRHDAHGTGIPLTSYRHKADGVADMLREIGFHVSAVIVRDAELAHESTPQAFVTAARAATT